MRKISVKTHKMVDVDDGERRRIRVRGREGDEIEWSRKAARRAGRFDNWLNDLDPPEEAVFSITETSASASMRRRWLTGTAGSSDR